MMITALLLAAAFHAAETPAPRPEEFIRVAEDNWHFEGAESGAPFIPFGSNYVLSEKEDLNLFGKRYDTARHDRILAACADRNMTLIKIFLPIKEVLPDPQPEDRAEIAPGWRDNLENFLGLCRKHDIRAVVSFSPWGGNECRWWHDGGQYWGRYPWKQEAGPDSNAILVSFWQQIIERFGNNPAIFSWTPAVEWTLPMLNLTWFPPHGHSPHIDTEPGRWYWRRWLEEKYGAVENLNNAWGAARANFDAASLPDFEYDYGNHAYREPVQKIYDYQNFREWTSRRYFRPQIEAIRAAGAKQLVTLSCHMRFWDLWEGGAEHFLGITPFEIKPMLDYIAFHANFHENERLPGQTDADIVQAARAVARFVAAGKKMPVILEEFSYTSRDPERTAEVQAAIVRGTIGHVSGWTTWYFQYPENPAEGTGTTAPAAASYWLDHNLVPSPWGKAAAKLYRNLHATDLDRKPPRTLIRLDRREALVPHEASAFLLDVRNNLELPRPADYELTPLPERDLVIPRQPRNTTP
jgi:hypothetical protein